MRWPLETSNRRDELGRYGESFAITGLVSDWNDPGVRTGVRNIPGEWIRTLALQVGFDFPEDRGVQLP